jgi:lipoprotein NlpD
MSWYARQWPVLIILALAWASVGCMNRSDSMPAPVREIKDPGGTYRVKVGDTLHSIAWGLELDYQALARWNGIPPPYQIRPGQTLLIRPPRPGVAAKTVRQRSDNGVITRKVAPQFLSWRADDWEIPAPRNNLRWSWPASGKVAKERSGIVIQGSLGAPVKAAEMGQVVYSGDGLKGYGNLVIIKHRHNYLSAYGHNRRVMVKEGDLVGRGETIAEMGEGRGEARLYFEIRHNTLPEDPRQLLPPPA